MQGELVANSSITHDFEATVFDWHPTERILAIGWGDGAFFLVILSPQRSYLNFHLSPSCSFHGIFLGMVSCWSVDGKTKPTSTFTNNVQHTSTITVMKWNPAGKRLVTGDKVGIDESECCTFLWESDYLFICKQFFPLFYTVFLLPCM